MKQGVACRNGHRTVLLDQISCERTKRRSRTHVLRWCCSRGGRCLLFGFGGILKFATRVRLVLVMYAWTELTVMALRSKALKRCNAYLIHSSPAWLARVLASAMAASISCSCFKRKGCK